MSKVKPASLANLKIYKKGESGNPGGKPTAARNKLQGRFLNALADDFEVGGVEAIQRMRLETPALYIKAIASLMPKEMEIKRPLEDLTDDDLIAGVTALQRLIDSTGDAIGTGNEAQSEQTSGLPTIQ